MQLKNLSVLLAACLLSSVAAAQGLASRVISGKTVESVRFGPDMTDVQILVPNDDGKGTMSAGTERLPAKVAIPVHFHPGTEEFIYILEGEGTVTLDGKVSKVSQGDMILIAPGSRHGLVNTGSGNLKMLWSYNNRKMVDFFREFSFKNAADRDARATHAYWDMLAKKYSDTIVVLLPEGEQK